MVNQQLVTERLTEAVQLLRKRVTAFMTKEKITFASEVARRAGMGRCTVERVLRPRNVRYLPSGTNLDTLRRTVTTLTDEDMRLIKDASKLSMSASRSRGGSIRWGKKVTRTPSAKAPIPRTQPSKKGLPLSVEQKISEIWDVVTKLRGVFGSTGAAKSQAETPVSADVLARLLLSRNDQVKNVEGFPFVLTKDNFQSVDTGKWTAAEKDAFLAFVQFVLEEARMCLSLIAQIKVDSDREELLSRIGKNADLLWRTYKVASALIPMAYLQDIDLTGALGGKL